MIRITFTLALVFVCLGWPTGSFGQSAPIRLTLADAVARGFEDRKSVV